MRAVTGRTKGTIAGVLASAVVIFAGIAGQAQATSGCKVTFGGWITTAAGAKATFGGNSHAVGQKGQIEYQDHGSTTNINVHSIEVHSVSCGGDVEVSSILGVNGIFGSEPSSFGTQATITGTATIDGKGSFEYQIDVTDLGEPGSSDTFRLQLSNGYDSGVQTLNGGNVQVH
jgi:hypothetical protein